MSKFAAAVMFTMLVSCQGCATDIKDGKTTVRFPKLAESATAATIRETNVSAGIYKSSDQVAWLTDEFLAKHRKEAAEVKSEMVDVERGRLHVITTYAGNHFFVDTGANGQTRWNWMSGDPGNAACGQKHSVFCYPSWYSTYVDSTYSCVEGFHYYEVTP